jgi:SAM-dependent methyltransferase
VPQFEPARAYSMWRPEREVRRWPRRVGPAGHVLATDLSPAILEYAAAAARSAGLENVETRELDGESLAGIEDESADAVISRLGIIYFPDQLGALAETRRVLRPGGRLAVVVWSKPEKGRFFSVAVGIIRRRAELAPPLPGQPGPFSLGTDGVLAAAFEQAGFSDVSVQTVPSPLRMTSAAECLRLQQESYGALHQMLPASTRPVAKRHGTRLERRSPSSTARMALSGRASCWWVPQPDSTSSRRRGRTEPRPSSRWKVGYVI